LEGKRRRETAGGKMGVALQLDLGVDALDSWIATQLVKSNGCSNADSLRGERGKNANL